MADSVKSDESQLATKASADDVNGVKTDVNGVRTDLDSTKQGLLDARNELGTQIAHNHDELDQLRRLGQRDYLEFTVGNKGGKQKLGDVTLELRGTNLKHNQYTVDLYVDDMRLEKKNRSVNEPIFFYTRGSRAAMELVVNQVGKDKIVGYLSVPKVQSAQVLLYPGQLVLGFTSIRLRAVQDARAAVSLTKTQTGGPFQAPPVCVFTVDCW